MDLGLLIASSHGGGHGPQMHGPVVFFLLTLALVAGVVFLVLKARAGKDSGGDGDAVNDRDPGPGTPSDTGSG